MRCPICESKAKIWSYFQTTPILRCIADDCCFRFFDLSKWKSPYGELDYYASWEPRKVTDLPPWIQARVKIVNRFIDRGKVAELGCGIGETAIALVDAGYQVVGVEESAKAINFLQKEYPRVEWSNSSIPEFLKGNPASFDAISMFHVLEHMPYPKRIVKLMDTSLRPDGIIVIEVPDVGGGLARLQGAKWDYFLDHHVNYFDIRSLNKLFGLFRYRMVFLERTYHFSFPQGNLFKDTVKGTLARLGLNSIIRTVWSR